MMLSAKVSKIIQTTKLSREILIFSYGTGAFNKAPLLRDKAGLLPNKGRLLKIESHVAILIY